MPRAASHTVPLEQVGSWYGEWWRLALAHSLRLAPETLFQAINPGWTFGNVFINNRNSGDPETELRIVQEVSYGRQLGRTLDAVAVLVAEADRSRLEPKEELALQEFTRLVAQVDRVKRAAESAPDADPAGELLKGIESLASCLRRVKAHDPDLHAAMSARLLEAVQDAAAAPPDTPRLTTSL